MMEASKPDLIKALALLISAAALFFWGYQAISMLMKSRSEGRARAVARKVLPADGLVFGRFNDFGHGVSCLEFTILRERKTRQYGAVIITGEDRAESHQKVRAVLPSYQECLIEGAG